MVGILTLILTFLPNRPSYQQASILVLGKIYSNSMMVVFNSRVKIGITNSTSVTTHEVEIPTLSIRTGTGTTRSGGDANAFQGDGVLADTRLDADRTDTLSLSVRVQCLLWLLLSHASLTYLGRREKTCCSGYRRAYSEAL